MKNLLKNRFQVIDYDKELKIMSFRWLSATQNMSDTQFLKEAENIAKFITEKSPDFILVDAVNMKYLISPNMQKEFDSIVLPAYLSGKVEKLAFIIDKDDFIEKISIEQTIDLNLKLHKFETKFFYDENKAKDWLLP